MAHTNLGLEGSYGVIKLLPTHDVDDPLDQVVKEELVEHMEDIDGEKERGVGVTPVHPEWLMYPL